MSSSKVDVHELIAWELDEYSYRKSSMGLRGEGFAKKIEWAQQKLTERELGATEPWFFSEEQLFSDRPPRVRDFFDENLVLRYARTALRKVIRIRIEESLEAFDEPEVQGEEI